MPSKVILQSPRAPLLLWETTGQILFALHTEPQTLKTTLWKRKQAHPMVMGAKLSASRKGAGGAPGATGSRMRTGRAEPAGLIPRPSWRGEAQYTDIKRMNRPPSCILLACFRIDFLVLQRT